MSNVLPFPAAPATSFGAGPSTARTGTKYLDGNRRTVIVSVPSGDSQARLSVKVTGDSFYSAYIAYPQRYRDFTFATIGGTALNPLEHQAIQGEVVTDKSNALNTFITVTVPVVAVLLGGLGVGWGAYQSLDSGIEQVRLETKADLQRVADKVDARFDRLEAKIDRLLDSGRE